ncbi:MAG: protein kinase [Pseudomonas sp.]|uniref:serine/threonine-protein kinase n=1 Tax=Pseudomonas sp. TaxID=306 RepID=UPI003395E11B
MNEALIEIPGYTVHRRLGQGGMAEVYLATQDSLQRKVAIKVLLNTQDQTFLQRFVNEAKLVASLHHPNIITIHDIDRLDDSRYYIAMEYVPGGDLSQHKGSRLAPGRALDITRQIAAGLALVHEQGLVHRDIKPANILFRLDGTVVISDFGIAKDLSIDHELTHFGIAVGSPSYSSPEQAQCEALDQRSDIYSLGVILLEMLSGENSYRGSHYTQTVLNHLQMQIPALPQELSRFQPLLDRMLAKQPADRYADCQALLDDLDRLLDDAPDITQLRRTAVAGAAKTPAPSRWTAPRSLLAAVGLAVLVGLLLAAGWAIRLKMQVAGLIDQAEQRLAENKLIEPERDNADYFYHQALLLDSDNREAEQGLQRVFEARLTRLLGRAEQAIVDGHLTTPAYDNAVFFFNQALQLDPANEAASAGLQRVVEMHVQLAEDAHARHAYAEGLEYIQQGLELAPDNPALQGLLQTNEQGQRASNVPPFRRSTNPLKRIWNKLIN